VQSNVLLKNYTTYKIGGRAKYFFSVKTKEDLIKAIGFAKGKRMPIFILGGGSNTLISEKGFLGLVIKIDIKEIDFKKNQAFVGAGASATKIASLAAKNGLSGFEWVSGIPAATIGGCIFGHAQAFGDRISDVVKSVEVFNTKTLEFKSLNKKQCKFCLKSSIVKKDKNLIIISAVLQFKKKSKKEIAKKIKEVTKYRKEHHPMNYPSAGSTFVNPEVSARGGSAFGGKKELLEKYPELKDFLKKGVIPSGYLIEKAGLVGKKIGGAEISKKHCNFIVNKGSAKSKDVLALIKLAQKKVKKEFGIELESEVQLIGF
jgi:UDP-N-acetylmuramate dehydrogenase